MIIIRRHIRSDCQYIIRISLLDLNLEQFCTNSTGHHCYQKTGARCNLFLDGTPCRPQTIVARLKMHTSFWHDTRISKLDPDSLVVSRKTSTYGHKDDLRWCSLPRSDRLSLRRLQEQFDESIYKFC
ncbi:hypothetical protein EG68_04908 [Paragonimus skrjabini miyazakii]|uniref:Uncharacterized protein n=1 Tax=Paragonimus skrjabini miyazakii TaxID=59628 RepID=A0A8S9YTE2_9TREM|nr:hypothetical protein EG68_04908 [Paragonimus skrjabini miyazakii]